MNGAAQVFGFIIVVLLVAYYFVSDSVKPE